MLHKTEFLTLLDNAELSGVHQSQPVNRELAELVIAVSHILSVRVLLWRKLSKILRIFLIPREIKRLPTCLNLRLILIVVLRL